MQKAIKSQLKEKGELMIHDKIKNTSSLNQYYNNFKKVLLSHIDNISEYKGAIVKAIGESLTHMSREDQKVCRDVLKKLAVSGGETVVNNIKSKYSLPELKTPFGEK